MPAPDPTTPIPPHVLSLPMRIRVSLWMVLGTAMGIPVDAFVQSVDLELQAAKKQLVGKRLQMSLTERLRKAKLATQLCGPLRDLIRWIVSPESLLRWLKRCQQRMANGNGNGNGNGKNQPAKPKRPWIRQEKVAAILRFYDPGLTGLSRIVGEMGKCGLPVVESTVRRVLNPNNRPPGNANNRTGSTWAQFWNRHAEWIVGANFIQIPIGLFGKAVVFVGIEHDTRRVHLLGITTTDAWVANALRHHGWRTAGST